MSEEIHLTPEELERISKAIGNFGSKIQALVDMAKIPEGIIAFFESPAWGNVQKIIADAYNVNEKLLNGYDNSVLQASFEKIGRSLVSLPDSRLMTQIDKLLTPDYTNVVKNLGSILGKMSSIISEAYEMAQNYAFDEEESDLETEFISQQEFEEAFAEQVENPLGFQERIANWAEAKKKKYYVIVLTVLFIWTNFVQPYFQDKIGVPVTAYVVSNVKELPEKASKVICQLKEEVEAIIVENTDYYYKVKFVDEDGVEREGYVAKRNLKLLEEDSEEETTDENTEPQE